MNNKLHGLYVITDRHLQLSRRMPLHEMVAEAIAGGARIVQYRDKESDSTRRYEEAMALVTLCREHHVILLINDDVDLALAVDADGVHLGQTDLPLQYAREKLGHGKLIGITCHNDLELARASEQIGADYVAFGRFFASQSKPSATPCTMEILQQAHTQLHIPITAIGGITPANGKQLVTHGAHMLAVIHGVFGAADIREAAQSYAQLFVQYSPQAANLV